MTPEIFESLGKYAGLAGFSVGLVLWIFLAIIKKFPVGTIRSPEHLYGLFKLLIILTFATGAVGIVTWALMNKRPGITVSKVSGTVRDKDSGLFIEGAIATLAGRTDDTNDVGYFSLDLSDPSTGSATHHLYIQKPGYSPFDKEVTPGQFLDVTLGKVKPVRLDTASPPPIATHSTWTDPDTKLMWAAKDNGGDLTWAQAQDYCGTLDLAKHRDWRLPTLEEVKGIYDIRLNVPGGPGSSSGIWHVKGNLLLTGGVWVRPSKSNGEVLTYGFDVDRADPTLRDMGPDFRITKRALCVRTFN
jgi:hypothetical protein